jgi:ribose/xylose/arabinose/galactoside ABC-type transport system permease subunit
MRPAGPALRRRAHPEKGGPMDLAGTSTAAHRAPLRALLRGPLAFISRGITGQLVALALVFVIFSVGTGGSFLSFRNIQTILSLAGLPMIICLGIHLVIVIGGMDLSTEGVITLCAVVCGFLIKNPFTAHDFGFWAVPIAIAIGTLCGLLSGLLNTFARMPSFIATLGVWWTTQGLAVIIGRGASVKMLDTRFQVIANQDSYGVPNSILLALVLFAAVQLMEKRTRFGRYMYAIGGDEALARQAGIDVRRVKIIVFALAGAIYGLVSILLAARLAASTPRTGTGLLFPAMTAVAVGGVSLSGGVGGALNAVFGALIVTSLNDGMVLMRISPYVQNAVNGVVLIVAVALTIDRRKIGIIK